MAAFSHPPVALVLSGGNALGAYQAGAYEALAAAGLEPDWVSGASAGSINAALIAGNPPAERVARLRQFWRPGQAEGDGGPLDRWRRTAAAAWTMLAGRTGVFGPRLDHWTLDPPSLYDTRPLADTIAALIDMDRLNSGSPRFSAAAVDLESGEDVIFDSARAPVLLEQMRGSAGLIPVFPPVEVDGRLLVDAGISANLPLDAVMLDLPSSGALVFAIDLLPLAAPRPTDVAGVAERMQDLIFATQSRRALMAWQMVMDERCARARATGGAPPPPVTVIHLIDSDQGSEVVGKAFDFSPISIAERWRRGRRDTELAIAALASGSVPLDRPGLSVHRRDGPRAA